MKNNRKSRLINAVLIATLLLGIALFIFPFALDWQQTAQRAQHETTYEQAYIPRPGGLSAKIAAYNRMIYAQQQGKPATKVPITALQKDLKDPIGYLDIPAIKLKAMTIYFGDSDWVLSRALGTLPFTSLPTGGKNTLGGITGHSGLANRIFFDNIRYLKAGDVIYVNVLGARHAYAVTGKKVVDPKSPTAVKAFYVQPGKARIALMTCTPLFVNSHRLIVYAKRVPLKKAAAKKVADRTFWSVEHIWLAVIGAFLLLLLLALWGRRRRHAQTR
ncbi:class C sortase [Lacticaseibacillus jixianensis]|uniref:Class C sortase n=1 Tax=Lacticaseibacillus jixianensis TaxID=2486012 RepID=A0ABW4B7D4_9LACO|nr:class C sortase [Lacticaseibacillus jixianensis]